MTFPICVVGSGRCGTKTVAKLFADLGYDSRHESQLRIHTVQPASEVAHGRMTLQRAARILAFCQDWGQVEADYKLSELIPAVREVHPQARFVWLIRSGFEAVASMVANRWYWWDDDFRRPGYEARWMLEGIGLWWEYRYEAHRTRGDLAGHMSAGLWHSLDPVAKASWWWGYVNRTISQHLAGLPQDDWRLVRLEDLAGEADSLCRWAVGEPAPPVGWENQTTAPLATVDWDQAHVEVFAKLAGDVQETYYPPTGAAKLAP